MLCAVCCVGCVMFGVCRLLFVVNRKCVVRWCLRIVCCCLFCVVCCVWFVVVCRVLSAVGNCATCLLLFVICCVVVC